MTDFHAQAAEHNRVVEHFFVGYASALADLANTIGTCLQQGNKLLLCGNGGSACDAMHIAGEFVGRFKRERQGLAAIALSADSGILTALGNDYGFERIFARQVETLGNPGDLLIALSTSGQSPNVLAAMEAAKVQSISVALFTGTNGTEKAAQTQHGFVIDSTDTARIQECTMLALHLLAEGVENGLPSS